MSLALPSPIAKVGAIVRNALGLDVIDLDALCPRGVDHEWVAYPGGSACLHCPAWKFKARTEEHVEKHPASSLSLADAVASIRTSLAAEPVLPPTVAVPLPSVENALPSVTIPEPTVTTAPVQQHLPDDRRFQVINAMLPIIGEHVTLSQLDAVAARIEGILAP